MLPVVGNRQIYGSQFSDLPVAALGMGIRHLISLQAALHTSFEISTFIPLFAILEQPLPQGTRADRRTGTTTGLQTQFVELSLFRQTCYAT